MVPPSEFPAVVAWASDHLDIFQVGINGTMFHKAWDGATWRPSPTGWESLGGVFKSPPAAVAWGPNRLDIFGLGTDRSMFHKAWTGSDWYPSQLDWEWLGGRFTSGDLRGVPTVCAWGPDRLDIFGVGADSAMYHKAWGGATWHPSPSDWERLGGSFHNAPAVAAWGSDRLDIFAMGDWFSGYSLLHKAWDGATWHPSTTGWENLGGPMTYRPAVAAWGSDRLDIFAVNGQGIMHKAWTGATWSPSTTGWERLGGYFRRSPAVAAWGPDRLDIFAVDGYGAWMAHKAWTGPTWYPSTTGWENLGGLFPYAVFPEK
jgi:hypothetical protein